MSLKLFTITLAVFAFSAMAMVMADDAKQTNMAKVDNGRKSNDPDLAGSIFKPQTALSVKWYSAGTCHPASLVATQNVNDNTCTTPPASVGGPQYKATCPGNPNETYTKYSGSGCSGTPTAFTGAGCFSISGKYVIISGCP